MVRRRAVRLAMAVATVALASCSANGDGAAAVTSPSTSDPTQMAGADTSADTPSPTTLTTVSTVSTATTEAPVTTTTPVTTVVPSTTEELRPGVVARDGSVETVLSSLSEATNFATGVASWLAAVPGQEGVLRNARGITLFVPVDEGFSATDADAAFAEPNVAANTISEHLHVGVLQDLTGVVTTASGTEHVIGAGPTIGGRAVVRTVEATNGVVHLIDGPLQPGV